MCVCECVCMCMYVYVCVYVLFGVFVCFFEGKVMFNYRHRLCICQVRLRPEVEGVLWSKARATSLGDKEHPNYYMVSFIVVYFYDRPRALACSSRVPCTILCAGFLTSIGLRKYCCLVSFANVKLCFVL